MSIGAGADDSAPHKKHQPRGEAWNNHKTNQREKCSTQKSTWQTLPSVVYVSVCVILTPIAGEVNLDSATAPDGPVWQ